jgi:hypothetical protein
VPEKYIRPFEPKRGGRPNQRNEPLKHPLPQGGEALGEGAKVYEKDIACLSALADARARRKSMFMRSLIQMPARGIEVIPVSPL